MASTIDPTKPETGLATTQSVRDNFAAAKADIESVQGIAGPVYDTLAIAVEQAPSSPKNALRTSGNLSINDGGGATYRKVASEPSHPGKFLDAAGQWWELAERVLTPSMFGAAGNGVADDTAALLNCLTSPVATAVQIPAGKTYLATNDICTARTFAGTATNGSFDITGITRITVDIPVGSVVSLLDATTRQPVAFADGSYTAGTTTGFILTSTTPPPPKYKVTLDKALPALPAFSGTVIAYVVADYARGPVSIGGGGTIRLSSGKRIRVATPRTRISGLTIDANDAEYAIAVELPGEGAIIDGNHFYGGTGNYVSIFAPNVVVNGNVMDGTSSTGVGTPIAMASYNAIGCVIASNSIKNFRGFGIQTLHAKNVTIANNDIYSDTYITAQQVGDGATTVFNFAFTDGFGAAVGCPRRAILVDDVPFTVTGVTFLDTSGGNATSWQVTFSAPPAVAVTLRMIGWRGKEPININSDSFNISIVGNTILGSGDSGIVIADDESTPVPPERVTVANNVIEGVKGAAIAMTHAGKQISIIGNTCKDWGWAQDSATDAVFTAGIVATGDSVTAMGNTLVSNQLSPAGSIKSTRAGITWNSYPSSTADLLLDNDLGDGDALLKFGGNIFMGSFPLGKYYMPNTSQTRRKFSAVITDAPVVPWTSVDTTTAFTTKPANTTELTYGTTLGTAWVRDTTTILGGTASIRVTGTVGTESYVSFSPVASAQPRFLRKILIVDFDAIMAGGTGYLSVFSNIGGNTDRVRVNVTKTTWDHYTLRVPITAAEQLTSLLFRIGANTGTSNDGYFQNISFSLQTIPT